MPGFGRGPPGPALPPGAAAGARRHLAGRAGLTRTRAGRARRRPRCRRHRTGCCRSAGRDAGRARAGVAAGAPADAAARPARRSAGAAGAAGGRAAAGGAAGAAGCRLGRRGRRDRRGGRGLGAGAAAPRPAAAAFLAGAFLAGAWAQAAGNASRSWRATGASTVEEARLHVLAELAELGEYFLAGDSELFGERGYAGLACHVTPSEGPGGIPHGPVRRWTYSSLALHRVPIALSSPAGFRWSVTALVDAAADVLAHRRRVERRRAPAGPGRTPGAARRVRRTPGRGAARHLGRVRDAADRAPTGRASRRIRRHDDAEQLGGRRTSAGTRCTSGSGLVP